MKYLFFLTSLLFSNYLVCQVLESSRSSQQVSMHGDYSSNREYLNSSVFLLDSILSKRLLPNDIILNKSFYKYYNDGMIKSDELYELVDEQLIPVIKFNFEYDSDSRLNKKIRSINLNDEDWQQYRKTTWIWFDDEFVSEIITYVWDWDESDWRPEYKSVSPDMRISDSFTTYSFVWDYQNNIWDSTERSISFLNENNKIDTIYNYDNFLDYWRFNSITAIEYTDNGTILNEINYYINNEGGQTINTKDEYEYDPDDNLINKWHRWGDDGVMFWYHRDNWDYDELGRLWKYYKFSYSPAYPEPTGGKEFEIVYNDLDLIDYKKLYGGSNTHTLNQFYYYSEFYVDIEKVKSFEFFFFPNPTSNYLFISGTTKIDEMVLFDQWGRQIMHLKEPDNHIDISGITKGLFVVKVRYNNKWFTAKIIRQ